MAPLVSPSRTRRRLDPEQRLAASKSISLTPVVNAPRTCNLCPGKTSRGETAGARTPASYAERPTSPVLTHADVTAQPPDAQPPCSAAVTTQGSPAKPRATPARLQLGAHPRPPPAWPDASRPPEQSRTARCLTAPGSLHWAAVSESICGAAGWGRPPEPSGTLSRMGRCLSCSRTWGLSHLPAAGALRRKQLRGPAPPVLGRPGDCWATWSSSLGVLRSRQGFVFARAPLGPGAAACGARLPRTVVR